MNYPKRLIEVDLPIKRISAHARREKSIRHGHISTLHIWWARRPLAACRAVICGALWPDPADPICPAAFIEKAREEMLFWTSHERQQLLSGESCTRFEKARRKHALFDDPLQLRGALLDFIADFANWDNSTVREYLGTSRALTQAAHEALGGAPGTRPLVVDPFAGGGSIPLEALRVGADAFASDLNPVPVLLNKVVLEYIPKYGKRLADEVRKWGEWIKREAEKELAEFYPKDADGATPIAYLWARTIQCEGPGCGAEVPLIRSLWLGKKANRSVALQLVPNKKAKRVDFQIIIKQRADWVNQDNQKETIADPKLDGTVKRGSATCPSCGYTTPVACVREQVKHFKGGANNATLMCVVTTSREQLGRTYRLARPADFAAIGRASSVLTDRVREHPDEISLVPDEKYPDETGAGAISSSVLYGFKTWGDLYTDRQLVTLTTLVRLINEAVEKVRQSGAADIAPAIASCLALNFGRVADLANSLCGWTLDTQCTKHLFARQAIPMVWNFAEGVPIGDSAGSWGVVVDRFGDILASFPADLWTGQTQRADAAKSPLADDIASALVTDPPYYDAIAYGDLSNFFYVWLRRILREEREQLLSTVLVDTTEEAVSLSKRFRGPYAHKTSAYFENKMRDALSESRRVVTPTGIGVVVFAHKSTAGWEAQLRAMIEAGWIVTGSWPIDTEMGSRMNAMGTASLASSVHLVCRPRENPDGSVRTDKVGDWRDVLQELPRRIHEWMPRLAEEGVVGADAIFACLGPALEIFSRYSRVEKASGEAVPLKEYLEQVWAAVAKEALALVFKDADTASFEADARLTAMWLWTLNAANGTNEKGEYADEEGEEESEGGAKKPKVTGFILEYDTARKIAQGLGASLEQLDSLVEIKGDTARLLPVAERARSLFGKSEGKISAKRQSKEPQLDLFKVLEDAESDGNFADVSVSRPGETVLDRIHQSMILFAAGRAEAVKRFLVEDGVGRDQRFWRLAQALSALYPASTDEKRWVDGILARKKGLGL